MGIEEVLLGSRGIELPDPVAQAKAGLSLADLSSQVQNRQYLLKAAERKDRATQALGQLLPQLQQAGFSDKAVQAALTHPLVRDNPDIAGAILNEADAQRKSRLEAKKTEAATGKDVAETKAKVLPFITNQAFALYNKKDLSPEDLRGLSNMIASNGLEHLVQGIPFQTWQNPESARAGLKQIYSAAYDAEKQAEAAATGTQRGIENVLNREKFASEAAHRKATEAARWAEIGIQRENAGKPTLFTAEGGETYAVDPRKPSGAVRITADGVPLVKDTGQAKRTDAQVQQLAKMLEQQNLPGLRASVQLVNETLDKYSSGDVPGIGPIKNVMPAWVMSAEGKLVRSRIQGVANDLLKLYSGGAVTLNEAQRRAAETMSSGGYTQEDLYAGWPLIVERVNAAMANARASVPQEAVDVYQQRQGVSLDPIEPAQRAVKGTAKTQPANKADRLPDPAMLQEGDIVTNDQTGKKLKVHDGKYVPL